ncbi:hypothetical protein EON63_04825, partial [archaeon]
MVYSVWCIVYMICVECLWISCYTCDMRILTPIPIFLLGKSKTVAFTHDKDISCKLQYSESELLSVGNTKYTIHHTPNIIQHTKPLLYHPGTNPLIAQYNITGIAAFTKDHAQHIYSPTSPSSPS